MKKKAGQERPNRKSIKNPFELQTTKIAMVFDGDPENDIWVDDPMLLHNLIQRMSINKVEGISMHAKALKKKYPSYDELLKLAAEQAWVLSNPKLCLMKVIFSELLKSEAQQQDRKIGAEIKHERDPRQREKKEVYEAWKMWQKNPNEYESKADFARQMLDKCEYLTSQKKIEDWCRAWGKST